MNQCSHIPSRFDRTLGIHYSLPAHFIRTLERSVRSPLTTLDKPYAFSATSTRPLEAKLQQFLRALAELSVSLSAAICTYFYGGQLWRPKSVPSVEPLANIAARSWLITDLECNLFNPA